MGKIIGIDLGSTLSEVSVYEGGKPTIIVNEEGSRTTPSVIFFDGDEKKVGAAAKRQAITNPKNTVVLIKRFMGCTYDEVKEFVDRFQYEIKNVNGYPKVVINGKEYSPEEISAMILQKMKKTAEDYLGEEVKEAVITCPAFYNDQQRQSVFNAGRIAGLEVKRVVAEPTAAILASGIDLKKQGKYIVADYGGSTTDFSVADVSDGVVEILASHGDVFAGGSDLDKLVTDYIVSEFKKDNGVDLSKDPMAMSRIVEAAEKAKIELTSTSSTDISLPYITVSDNVPLHLNMTLTRARFEQLIGPEIDKIIGCAKEALNKANMKASELDGIILVGGSTRIPYVQRMLEDTFGLKLIKGQNPDEVVSLGAAVQASILAGEKDDVLLLDAVPISYSIETLGGLATKIVEQGTTIPATREQIFSTAQDGQTAVTIRVLQGERPMASDNKTIGVFNLEGIPYALRGTPQIEVKFDISADGILKVSAKDKGTGKEQSITIENSSLSEEEIERMKKEAEANADADNKKREEVDKLNHADGMAFSIEKSMDEMKDSISEDEKTKIKSIIDDIKKAVSDKDSQLADEKVKELEKEWQPIMVKAYQAQAPSGQTANGGFDFNDIFKGAQQYGGGSGPQGGVDDVQEAQEV